MAHTGTVAHVFIKAYFDGGNAQGLQGADLARCLEVIIEKAKIVATETEQEV